MKRYIVAKVLAVLLMAVFATTAIAADAIGDGPNNTPAELDPGTAGGGGGSGAGVGNF